jgi:hypothetical protein
MITGQLKIIKSSLPVPAEAEFGQGVLSLHRHVQGDRPVTDRASGDAEADQRPVTATG